MADPVGESRPEGRPAPQYGEYAPDGWEPQARGEGPVDGSKPRADAAAGPAPHGGDARQSGGPTDPPPAAGPVPGVPHNLGAGSAGDRPASAPDARHVSKFDTPAAPNRGARASTPGGRRADRVATIALLVFGALGALYFAEALRQLPASLETLARALEREDLTVPDSMSTLGTTGALTILALYALNLVFSIQRLRARRLAFWVPLATGVIALIVFFAFTSFAMVQAPQITELLTDPDALSKLLAYLGTESP